VDHLVAAMPVSLKEFVDGIPRSLDLQGCHDCTVIKIMADNFDTLERKLTAEELKSIFAIPATHFDGLDFYVGTKVHESVKKRLGTKLAQKSMDVALKCMKKYASDVFVQAVCTNVLYLATSKSYDLMHKLCSGGACASTGKLETLLNTP
jgi:hypothetical protein